MRLVAIIQARMGSNRLPGKVLADIEGWPLLEHVVRRVQIVVPQTWVATSTNSEDDAIDELCRSLNVPCYRGHPTDVLSRYVAVAEKAEATDIMRVTGDCPLWPAEAGRAVLQYRGDLPYVNNDTTWSGWADGTDTEVFTRACLEEAHACAVNVADREHVTPWMMRKVKAIRARPQWMTTGEQFQEWVYCNPCVVCYGHPPKPPKLSVDTQQDLDFVRAIFARMRPNKFFSYNETLAAAEAVTQERQAHA